MKMPTRNSNCVAYFFAASAPTWYPPSFVHSILLRVTGKARRRALNVVSESWPQASLSDVWNSPSDLLIALATYFHS